MCLDTVLGTTENKKMNNVDPALKELVFENVLENKI